MYWVGEKGPEEYVSESGQSSMVGMGGPEVRTFPQDGYIVPNHELGMNPMMNPLPEMEGIGRGQTTGRRGLPRGSGLALIDLPWRRPYRPSIDGGNNPGYGLVVVIVLIVPTAVPELGWGQAFQYAHVVENGWRPCMAFQAGPRAVRSRVMIPGTSARWGWEEGNYGEWTSPGNGRHGLLGQPPGLS